MNKKRKITKLLSTTGLVILPIVLLNGCTTLFVKFECDDLYDIPYAENDKYIIFPQAIYYKDKQYFKAINELKDSTYYSFKDALNIEILEDSYVVHTFYGDATFDFNANMLDYDINIDDYYGSYSLIRDGFYAMNQRYNPDEEELTILERKIWEYAKTKSIEKEWPYKIEGYCKEDDEYVYFDVNVHKTNTWKGGMLVNQGVVEASLNRINKTTYVIEELLSLQKCSIKTFFDDHVLYYSRKSDSIVYYNRQTNESTTLFKSQECGQCFDCGKYLITSDSFPLVNESSGDCKYIYNFENLGK